MARIEKQVAERIAIYWLTNAGTSETVASAVDAAPGYCRSIIRACKKGEYDYLKDQGMLATDKNGTIKSPKDTIIINDDGEELKGRLHSLYEPLTIDDIFKVFKLHSTKEININDYEVYSIKTESWDVTAWTEGGPEKVRNFLTDIRFKLKPESKRNTIKEKDIWLAEMNKKAPKLPIVHYKKQTSSDKYLLECELPDIHFGKLAIIHRTKRQNTLNFTKTLFLNAIEDIISDTAHYNIHKIVIPIGHDLMHYDNKQITTAKGTRVEGTNLWQKVFTVARESIIMGIDMLRQIAPVWIEMIEDNHSPHSTFTMGEVLNAWYRNVKEVHVNNSFDNNRKYFFDGVTLLGFTHGSEEKIASLSTLMASEVPELWAKAKFREFHIGHFHKKKELFYVGSDELNALRVRVLPSLAPADSWHIAKGFVKTRKCAEAYLWHVKEGYKGHISVNARYK